MRSRQFNARPSEWRKWYAWRPVRVYDRMVLPNYWKWVWLEMIYRRQKTEQKKIKGEYVTKCFWQYHINPQIDDSEQQTQGAQSQGLSAQQLQIQNKKAQIMAAYAKAQGSVYIAPSNPNSNFNSPYKTP